MESEARGSCTHQGVGIRIRIVLRLRVAEVVARMHAAVAERAVHLRPATGAAGAYLGEIESPSVADEAAARAVGYAAEDVYLVDVRHVGGAAVGVARAWSAVAEGIGASWSWIRWIVRAGHLQRVEIEGVDFISGVVVVTAAPDPQDVAVGVGDAAVPGINHAVARAGVGRIRRAIRGDLLTCDIEPAERRRNSAAATAARGCVVDGYIHR